jgi:Trk-type K+ transport system membrane component
MLIIEYMVVTNRILRYIRGNVGLGIKFVRDSSLSINIGLEISLVALMIEGQHEVLSSLLERI